MLISKRSGVKSDKPSYKKKEKSEKGNVIYHYDEAHIEKRWKLKKEKLDRLDKNISKVRKEYEKDLTSDNERCRAIASIVGLIMDTGVRIGNEASAKEGTFGASTLKVKHVSGGPARMTFKFPGKGGIDQDIYIENNKVIKVIKELMKGKKKDDFIFELDGKKIFDRAVNRYLEKFDISAKDLRGYKANQLMKEILKKKKSLTFKEALEEVAEIVGHEPATLKNQYLDPDLVEEQEEKEKAAKEKEKESKKKDKGKKKKADLEISARRYKQLQQSEIGGEELQSTPYEGATKPPMMSMRDSLPPVNIYKNISNIRSKISPRGFEQVKITPQVVVAWKILAPFLPDGAELSSGFRSEQDQAFTISGLWHSKWNGYFAKNFPQHGNSITNMHRFMTDTYNNMPASQRPPGGPDKVFVAAPGESNHQSSNAMDVHKVDFDRAQVAAEWLNSVLGEYISLTPLKEGGQNNIHFTINKAIYPGPKNMESALRMWEHGSKSPQLFVSQSYEPELSKRALDKGDISYFRTKMREFFGNIGGGIALEQRKQLKIKPQVKVNSTIMAAWKLLQPYLPRGARMTSGVRDADDQKRILDSYWQISRAYLDYPDVNDYYQKSRILREYGYVVGPPTTNRQHGHLKGNAFDISGADLDEIADVVSKVSRHPRIPVRFGRPLVERKNNAVHVNIISVGGSATASDQSDELLKQSLLEDLVASDAPTEVLQAFGWQVSVDDGKLNIQLSDDMPDFNISDNSLPMSKKKKKVDKNKDGKADGEEADPTWFEQSPMFLSKKENLTYDVNRMSDQDVLGLAQKDPKRYFYLGLNKGKKRFKKFEYEALVNVIPMDASFYFKFDYHTDKRKKFRSLIQTAAEKMAQQNPRGFFYYHLHHKFPELGRGSIIQLIDTNPDSFFDLGLDKDYPEYVESANNARNIKDPNKVELEQPEWIKDDPDAPLSVREKNKKRATLKLAKKKKKHKSAGVFAVVPPDIAKQFPSLGDHDDSKAHITVLFIGEVPKEKHETVTGIIRDVTSQHKPFKVELDKAVSYFPATKHSDGCKVAKMAVISNELKKFHKALKKALLDANIEVADNFPTYKPHVTLEYMEPGKEQYTDDAPAGSWKVEEVEIWGLGDPRKIEIDKRGQPELNISKFASEPLTQDDLKKMYELEYSIDYLNRRGKGDDPYTRHMGQELKALLVKGLREIGKAFESWVSRYDNQFSEEIEDLVDMYKDHPNFEGVPEETIRDLLRDKHTNHPVYKTITQVAEELKRPPSKSNEQLVLFQKALNTAHFTTKTTGQGMLEHLPGFEDSGISVGLLDDLSGGKYTPYWKKDLRRWASISKRAGKIDAPQKLANKVIAWVEKEWPEIEQNIKKKLFDQETEDPTPPDIPEQLTNYISIDVSDTKQYKRFEDKFDALTDPESFSFNALKVVLNIYEKESEVIEKGISQGSYNGFIHGAQWPTLSISLYPGISEKTIRGTVEHELIHMMQEMMSFAARKADKDYPYGEAGGPTKYNEMWWHLYQGGKGGEAHARSDVEFFARLNDSFLRMQSFVGRQSLYPGEKEYAQEVSPYFTGNTLDELDSLIKKQFMQERLRYYLTRDKTLPHLKKTPSLYNKYMRELYRQFGEMIKAAEIKLSKRADAEEDDEKYEARSLSLMDPPRFFRRKLHLKYEDLAGPAAAAMNPNEFFNLNVHELFPDLVDRKVRQVQYMQMRPESGMAEYLAYHKPRVFFEMELPSIYPRLSNIARDRILATEKQTVPPPSKGRPEEAVERANKLYEEGYRTFIHIANVNKLEDIAAQWPQEMAVSTWDKSKSLFVTELPAVGAIFEGRASAVFEHDVSSEVDPSTGLRKKEMDFDDETRQVMREDFIDAGVLAQDQELWDEAWFNPNLPENKLVAFVVIGEGDGAEEMKKKVSALAEKHGVSFVEVAGNPKYMEQVREKPMMREVDEPDLMISKYRDLPEMRDYASLNLSKRAETPKMTPTQEEEQVFKFIKDTINAYDLGTTARVAGGWVRDKLMGKDSKDIDIAVDNMMGVEFAKHLQRYGDENNVEVKTGTIAAKPEQGKNLETAVVRMFGQEIEIVNLRSEEYNEETRHPETVLTNSPIKDAYRRDLTINSLFYNINTNTVEDFTGSGISDIREGIIRTPTTTPDLHEEVGDINSKRIFMDDPLRILRAIRFANRYGFEIAPELAEAAQDPEVQEAFRRKISKERIEIELRKIMSENKSPTYALNLIKEWGLRPDVLKLPDEYSEWDMDQQNPHHELSLWDHLMEALDNLYEIVKDKDVSSADRFILNWATLLHDVGKLDPSIQGTKEDSGNIIKTYHGHEEASMRAAEYLLKNLPGTRAEEIQRIQTLIDAARRMNPQHLSPEQKSKMSRRALGRILQLTKKFEQDWERALEVAMADASAHKKDWIGEYPRTYWDSLSEQFRGMPKDTGNMRPLIDGNELMNMFGRKGGRWMSVLNKAIIEWQMENPQATKEEAAQFAQEFYSSNSLDKMASIGLSKRADDRQEAEYLAANEPSRFFARSLDHAHPDLVEQARQNYQQEQSNYEREQAVGMAQNDPYTFLQSGWARRFPDLEEPAVKRLADNKPRMFFDLGYDEVFPQIAQQAAQNFARMDYYSFYSSYKMYEKYPEAAAVGAERLAENNPIKFLRMSLDEPYPEEGKLAAQIIAYTNPGTFIDFSLYDEYPEFLDQVTQSIIDGDTTSYHMSFLDDKKLVAKYPEWAKKVAASLAIKNYKVYFNQFKKATTLKEYPEATNAAAQQAIHNKDAEIFFYHKLYNIEGLKEVGREWAAKMVKEEPEDFIYYELFQAFPEEGRWLAGKMAEHDYEEFAQNDLAKIYPEIGKAGAARYLERNLLDFYKLGLHHVYKDVGETRVDALVRSYPREFFDLDVSEVYPEYEKSAAEYLLKEGSDEFFHQGLQKKYPEMAYERAKQILNEKSSYDSEIGERAFFRLKLHETYPELGRPAAEKMARKYPDTFIEYGLHGTYNDLAQELSVSEDLPIKPDDVKRNNFYSITHSNFQNNQRHPLMKDKTRYDMGINNPLGGEENILESEILSNLLHDSMTGHTSVGMRGYTKAWSLVAFPEPDVMFMEQIQSDLPQVLQHLTNEDNSAELREKYGEDKYMAFIDKYTKFSQAYPYIVIKKAAEMALKNNLKELRISDADTMVEVGEIVNRKKADRIYDIIPNKLGFQKRDQYWSYAGNMRELYNKARDLEDRVMGQQKQISKREKPTGVNMKGLKEDVSQVMGERTEELDFSAGAREFAKSVNMLKDVSNKNKKQLMGLINKHLKAFVRSLLIKIGEISGTKLSKRANNLPEQLTEQDVKSIYEIEYKLFQLAQRPYLEDNANVLKLRLREQLSGLLKKGLAALNVAAQRFLETQKSFYDTITQRYADDPENETYVRVKKYYEGMADLQKQLAAGPTEDLNKDMILFNRALGSAHSGGLAGYMTIKNMEQSEMIELFDTMSAGDYVPEWREQIGRVSKLKVSLRA